MWTITTLRQNFSKGFLEEAQGCITHWWWLTTSFQQWIRRNSMLPLKPAWHSRYYVANLAPNWDGGEGGVIFYLKNSGIHLSIKVDYGTPSSIPTFLLPDGVTRASLGRKMADFPSRRNFLDEYLFNLQWRRQRGLWSSLLNAERGGGVVQEGNLLDWRFTQFPQVLRRLITLSLCCSKNFPSRFSY